VPPRSPWVGVPLVGSGDGVGGPQAQKKGEGGLNSAGKLSMTGVPPWVPWRGCLPVTGDARAEVPPPPRNACQAPPSPKNWWGVGSHDLPGQCDRIRLRRETHPGKWGIPPPRGTLKGGATHFQMARGGRGVPRLEKKTGTPYGLMKRGDTCIACDGGIPP